MKDIDLIVYDFDGVLTDNRVLVLEDGREAVFCNRSDGWWMGRIRELNVKQCILSTEVNPVVSARGKKLDIEVIQGQKNKIVALEALLKRAETDWSRVAYVGNEMNDIDCLRKVAYPFAPADSHPEVLKVCTVFPVNGGAGIVRHLHDWLVS